MTTPDKDPETRAQELESIVDQLDAKVAGERAAQGVAGNASERERADTRGSETEPPD
ncbi:hypothetical protein [Mycobacterium sp.]|uniref:hypothetical protein n=1 Tax=Mycobacterium sp. TaxID=1785 RepID=UPI0025DA5085|nr:hypothetical protein [Mycobacterium sp.]MBW0015702.1 hypothetical protein [Mycobacterium sp.]